MPRADQVRAFVPKLEAGQQEVAVRAGDVHRALRLHNQMPSVCSAIESRKFMDAFELELVRREGPHRGSNAVYYFRRRPASSGIPRRATAPLLADKRATERARVATLTPSANAAAGTVYWISCVSQKRSSPAAARDLYVSDWFVKARRYVESTEAPWFILSAKYGLIEPGQVIEPYELTLNNLSVTDRRRWAVRVHEQLEALAERPRKVVMLAGARYREFVEPYLKSIDIEVEVPMEGLRIGEQLSWLGGAKPSGRRREDLRRYYALLDRLEQVLTAKKKLADCDGRMPWPRRGVYFFFERGEPRSETGSGLRVVRVGTHALTTGSSSTLWGRLSQHRGARSGGGNHRGSIFRLIVGAAMKRRDSREDPRSWGIDSDGTQAAERLNMTADALKSEEGWLEQAVSRFIGDLPFLYLAIDDEPGSESLRGFIERNAIALLSNFDREPLDAPSASWLGRHSDRDKVRRSGLWNNNHVDEEYDEEYLDVLERLIEQQGNGSSR
jgi:hypothetical protein